MLKPLLKKYPFYLALLPLFILTHIEREYYGLISYRFVYREIIFLLLIPPVLYLFSWSLMRSHRKAGIMTMALLLVYYFFGELKDSLKAAWPGSVWQSYIFLLGFFLVALCVAAVLIKRSKAKFEKTCLFLNTVLIFFVVFDLGTVLWSSVNKKGAGQQALTWSASSEKPDIYYFIFDSYTSTRFLRDKFGFDNSRVDSALTKKGFRVIANSHSNYNLTPFSLGSVFHLDFLPEADTSREYYLRNYLPGVGKVYENPLFPGMARLGYEVYNHSIFDIRSYPSSVPAYDIWGLNTIYQQHNLWEKMQTDIGWQFPRWLRSKRNTIQEYAASRDKHDSIAQQHISKTIQQPSSKPKFVYGHLFIPHSPYTFDSAGNKIEPIGVMPIDEDMKAYTQQIVYVNRIMMDLVEKILSSPKRPVAIIIQGDHGYRFFDKDKKQWEFPNFNAFYFSNGDYRLLHDSLTNVNTFRVVANTFFGQQYPMLKGHTWFLQYK